MPLKKKKGYSKDEKVKPTTIAPPPVPSKETSVFLKNFPTCILAILEGDEVTHLNFKDSLRKKKAFPTTFSCQAGLPEHFLWSTGHAPVEICWVHHASDPAALTSKKFHWLPMLRNSGTKRKMKSVYSRKYLSQNIIATGLGLQRDSYFQYPYICVESVAACSRRARKRLFLPPLLISR